MATVSMVIHHQKNENNLVHSSYSYQHTVNISTGSVKKLKKLFSDYSIQLFYMPVQFHTESISQAIEELL